MDWRYNGNLLRGFLVDATGHGLGTALHTASLHVLLREVNERDIPLTDAMRWLNRRATDYFEEGTFAGALGFELDLQLRQLRWICAGVPEVWMSTKTINGAVSKAGLFLGLQADEAFEAHVIPVDVGDSFFFMTDGLSDVLGQQTETPLNSYPQMVDLLRKLAVGVERRDDATAVCIHIRSLPQSSVCQDGWPRILRFNGYGDYQRLKGEVARILTEVTGLSHSQHEVAVNEALANAMECRDGVPRQHKARIRFNKVGNRFIIRVKTSRIGFAGNAVLRRLRSHPEDMFSFGEDASMGRGIPIMLSMSQKMIYNSEGTEVLMAWKL
jgi:anti-sigma regulatory factor (Ser/Thr protein kinase)